MLCNIMIIKLSHYRKYHLVPLSFLLLLIFSSWTGDASRNSQPSIEFSVSMENPNNHYFHVTMTYSNIKDKSVELKLPVWTPGYYMIMDYPKYVINFRVADGSGKDLAWEKTQKNRWLINTERISKIIVNYDVYAFRTSVADSFLDDGRAFISPTGIFMHPGGKKDSPVSVTVIPWKGFSEISTGLDPVPGRQNTYYAPDFDMLYDCPIIAGNQEIITFESGGIPYTIAAETLGSIDRKKLAEDYRKIVEAATAIIGEVPYRHYTFIMMNGGMGGLEHTNSMAVFSNLMDIKSPELSDGWLSFIAHEFFHLYNVKTIRPVALGPFDYDEENYTTMLWFSEGGTVYYENIILNRAGFYSREDVYRELKASIMNYENIPGSLFQSAAQSSFDTWMLFFNRSANASNTTISYYDKGCALTLLLDLAIRYESGNKKSLDDVMRSLYQVYYKDKKRGFTDKEFREVCEKTAGSSLSEIFDIYIPTTARINYSKYLAYAGLSIDTDPVGMPGSWIGTSTRDEGGNLVISRVEWNSPAYNAGLSPQDIIKEINGEKASAELLNNILSTGIPGDTITVAVAHRLRTNDVKITLGQKTIRSFEIKPVSDPTPEQSAILEKWLK
jgi:predicted metalloprotease with PDZ domain